MNRQFWRYALLAALLNPCNLLAGERAQTLLPVDLKQEPFLDAKVLLNLPTNNPVEVQLRKGGWVQVKVPDGTLGWLKMTSIKYGDAAVAKSDGGWGALLNSARGSRSASAGVTVTTGVRGLSAEELKNAKPAPEAVKRMDSFPNGKNEGQGFAKADQLQSQKIDYLAAPAVSSTESTNSPSTMNPLGGNR
jgi:hypothetical protein